MFAASGDAIKIGPVVAAASSILAGAGMELLAGAGATDAPASFNSGVDAVGGGAMDVPASANVGGADGDGVGEAVSTETETEVEVGGAGAGAAGALVGAMAILGATTAGASAGSWIWPSLIWETRFARAKGRRARKA